jgi:hypothetical protein
LVQFANKLNAAALFKVYFVITIELFEPILSLFLGK